MSERASDSRPLQVRVLRILGAEQRRVETTVRCPRREASIPASRCMACCDCDGVSAAGDHTYVLCSHPGAAADGPDSSSGAPMAARAAAAVRLCDIMTADVVCVLADHPLAQLLEVVLQKRLATMVVVDADGRPIGLVMRSALAQRLDRRTAADVMIPVPFVLHETASLTDAAMLVAYQAIDHTPVVSAEGRIVGMLASSDVCRLVNGTARASRMAR